MTICTCFEALTEYVRSATLLSRARRVPNLFSVLLQNHVTDITQFHATLKQQYTYISFVARAMIVVSILSYMIPLVFKVRK